MRKWIVVAAAGLSTALTACGGGGMMMMSGGGAGGSSGTQAIAPPQPVGEVIEGRAVVNIQDLQFDPDAITVPEGTTLIFTNNDRVAHSVTKVSGPGSDFDSGPIEPGGTYQQIVREKGTVKIEDTDRPETQLTVEVEDQEESAEGNETEGESGSGSESGSGTDNK